MKSFWNDADGFSIKDLLSLIIVVPTVLAFIAIMYKYLCKDYRITQLFINFFNAWSTFPLVVLVGYFANEGVPAISNAIRSVTEAKKDANKEENQNGL